MIVILLLLSVSLSVDISPDNKRCKPYAALVQDFQGDYWCIDVFQKYSCPIGMQLKFDERRDLSCRMR
jgi:hypothetical protein